MAKKPKLNIKAIQALRTSEEVTEFTRQQAERVAAAAGEGFVVKQSGSTTRARFVVVPTTREAYRVNAKEYRVVRALGEA